VRNIDLAYRIGPGEIALIVPETRARGALIAVSRLEERLLAAGVPSRAVTAGVAEAGPGVDRVQLCHEAHCALLVAGSEGRPRVLTYSPELEHAARSLGLKYPREIESFGGPAL
jgi:PleD family two-component response regulator